MEFCKSFKRVIMLSVCWWVIIYKKLDFSNCAMVWVYKKQIVSQELERKMMACTKQKGQNEERMPKPEKPCWTCQTLTTKTCSKCSFARYCNKDCQKKDWDLHKFFCASFPGLKNLQENPEDEICIGLLLPESSPLPVFVRVLKKSG